MRKFEDGLILKKFYWFEGYNQTMGCKRFLNVTHSMGATM
jgi:hypothetical protein